MELNKGFLAAVAALCVGAGAGGAYFATRESPPPPAAETVPGDISVEHSDGIVGETSAAANTAVTEEAPAVDPPPARRTVPKPAPAPRPASRPEAARVESPAPRLEPPPLTPPALELTRAEPEAAVSASQPPPPLFEDLVVAADSVLGLQVETSLSSEGAKIEDEVIARVSRDVRVGDRVAIPAGSRAVGEVTLVERGGRMRERARLGVRFTSVVLADGTRVPIETETIFREGDPPGGESAAKIGGGAIGGAIIGGILGGAKGAIIGGSAGAGAGTAAVMAGGRNPATLPSGTPVTVRITSPATVTVER